MFKKLIGVSMSVALAAGVLAGCGNNEEASTSSGSSGEGAEKKELTVQFVPSQNADTLEAKAKPLEKLLSDELDRAVKVSVSTDYNTIVEAMASKKVDVGFLPPTAYVLAKDQGAADVILQAQRYGVNDKDGSPTDELVDSYKSMFIVKKDSGIDSLEDLKGKKIGYQNVTSSAGYVWPAASLMDVGLDPLKDVQPVTLKGHDQAVISLLNGDIDAAVTFQDARTIVQKDYEDVFDQTKVIHYTEPIPNDTVAVQSDMDEDLRKEIQEAFINIGKDEEGKKIIRDIYTHEGYVKSDDSKFEIVREYGEKVKTE
ncbi:phosphate/phosphite/phosphonate ABC transporter substrate-binding protein [Priestia filamentosa]|uniref:Phosphonate-binding protein n=1 Tax=Priestia filamentosa TaxID=1402861 RepID=A0A1X7FKJ6_9BACI|nr:phosphate/phosphite/phosphonate ABC transporter substrate-binding protein [Priestia filamentosa]AKO91364.1 phosphonate-binding protein [Priestia filamentosa]MDT3765489.1 phosphate/phosphite/phosphonate ABC transporter substrate-binding protein [Priestia filamentosa]OXS67263.1 phosphonate-binding protein [Priestia filamentosa]RJS65252.1 phosphate/phosphite/phosphonate ABC transporter substrate-binding protein [Priestia filamentosa]WCM16544.1 phosphate/phosphite/phosphonate ABC transporter su